MAMSINQHKSHDLYKSMARRNIGGNTREKLQEALSIEQVSNWFAAVYERLDDKINLADEKGQTELVTELRNMRAIFRDYEPRIGDDPERANARLEDLFYKVRDLPSKFAGKFQDYVRKLVDTVQTASIEGIEEIPEPEIEQAPEEPAKAGEEEKPEEKGEEDFEDILGLGGEKPEELPAKESIEEDADEDDEEDADEDDEDDEDEDDEDEAFSVGDNIEIDKGDYVWSPTYGKLWVTATGVVGGLWTSDSEEDIETERGRGLKPHYVHAVQKQGRGKWYAVKIERGEDVGEVVAVGDNPKELDKTIGESILTEGLCPICGKKVSITGTTKNGRLIGSCKDAFTVKQWGGKVPKDIKHQLKKESKEIVKTTINEAQMLIVGQDMDEVARILMDLAKRGIGQFTVGRLAAEHGYQKAQQIIAEAYRHNLITPIAGGAYRLKNNQLLFQFIKEKKKENLAEAGKKVGDMVSIVSGGKKYQAMVKSLQPGGKYKLSFGDKAPEETEDAEREYEDDELGEE